MSGEVTYDPDADVVYVLLNDIHVEKTKALDDVRLIDYSADGAVVGIEFINASAGIDVRDIPFAQTVEGLIRDSGPAFPIYA